MQLSDILDGNGEPITRDYPVGARLSIRAKPKALPNGIVPTLFAWTTNPGTAINGCPSPEETHTFTMPKNDSGDFEIKVHAPILVD